VPYFKKQKIMANKKRILLIGIDPYIIDFTSPEFAAFPGMNAEKVAAGIKSSINQLAETGYDTDLCWIDFGKTAAATVQTKLQEDSFDGVLIGAGIRVPGSNFLLFEKLINAIHEYAPKAKMVFNTNPLDTIESVKRWT
jgi:hypothetical protein